MSLRYNVRTFRVHRPGCIAPQKSAPLGWDVGQDLRAVRERLIEMQWPICGNCIPLADADKIKGPIRLLPDDVRIHEDELREAAKLKEQKFRQWLIDQGLKPTMRKRKRRMSRNAKPKGVES